MAQSTFRRKNLAIVQNLTDDLISTLTGLDRADENFHIAQDFIMSNVTNNSFQDTNENDVKRMITNLCNKQRIFNQSERADRLAYLVEQFKKKPMKQEGISDSHMSMIHLLFLLADNPVGPNGYIDEQKRGPLGTKVYLTRE